ncbi:hypothetical protein NH288_08490 [Anaerococcus sp. NML200537]|uniref:hypothetical protein n=1 Tax=Anaerococcus sp. NML200537 TaxID=2954485 RepID=UPI00223805CB|nr:hypothetical protein [Anaerococcus sp. NML200537]MCW6702125.1 hypothetical protein [Anaerococcus sp. NML200537]
MTVKDLKKLLKDKYQVLSIKDVIEVYDLKNFLLVTIIDKKNRIYIPNDDLFRLDGIERKALISLIKDYCKKGE